MREWMSPLFDSWGTRFRIQSVPYILTLLSELLQQEETVKVSYQVFLGWHGTHAAVKL